MGACFDYGFAYPDDAEPGDDAPAVLLTPLRYRVEAPTVNEWLSCVDIAVWYEVAVVAQARAAYRSGQQMAKETAATIRAETEHLRRGD